MSRFAILLLGLAVLAGCGGSGGGGGSDGSPAPAAPAEMLPENAVARITIDAVSKTAFVDPIESSSSTRGLFTGSSFKVNPVSVFDDPSSLSVKSVTTTLLNQTGFTLNSANLVVSGMRSDTFATIVSSSMRISRAAFDGTAASVDGQAPVAQSNGCFDSWVDTDGAIYVTGLIEGRVRKIKDGVVSTIANGLSGPAGIAGIPGTNNIAVAESNAHRITILTKEGAVVARIGSVAGTSGNTNGNGEAARFNGPRGITISENGVMYIADRGNNQVRKVTDLAGLKTVTTAATGLSLVSGVAVGDLNGQEVVCAATTGSNTIHAILTPGAAPIAIAGAASSGFADGTGDAARFASPVDVEIANNAIYVADSANARIRMIAPTPGGISSSPQNWVVATIAGNGANGKLVGVGLTASFIAPSGVASDRTGGIIASDSSGHIVDRISLDNGFQWAAVKELLFTGNLVATTPPVVTNSDYVVPVRDGSGAIVDRRFFFNITKGLPPHVDSEEVKLDFEVPVGGPRFFSFLLAVEGTTTTSASLEMTSTSFGSTNVIVSADYGTLEVGFVDGAPTQARFGAELDVATDSAGRVYVADRINRAVRMIDTDGKVYTIAGNPQRTTITTGTGQTAGLGQPVGIEVTPDGDRVFITVGHGIRQLTLSGNRRVASNWSVSTLAGDPVTAGFVQGTLTASRFSSPSGMCFLPDADHLYVADSGNSAIRRIELRESVVALLAGGTVGSADGAGAAAQFRGVFDVSYGQDGELIAAERTRLRKVSLSGVTSHFAGSNTGLTGDVVGNATTTRFSNLTSVTVNAAGIAYTSDDVNNDLKGVTTGANSGTVVGILSGSAQLVGLGDRVAKGFDGVDILPGGDLVYCAGRTIGYVRRVISTGTPVQN